MKLFGLVEYKLSGTWPVDQLAATSTTLTIKYDPQGPTGNFVDKFYYGDETLTIDNYLSKGIFVLNSTTTTVSNLYFENLPQGRAVFLFGIRYIDGVQTSTSCFEMVLMPRDRIQVTPPLCDISSDWSQDSFSDWFKLGEHTPRLSFNKMSDGVLGNFIRIKSDYYYGIPDPGNDPNYDPEDAIDNIGIITFDGKKHLSPRYDWEVEFNYRLHGNSTFGQGMYLGINSGSQANATVGTHGSHDAWPDINPNPLPAGTTLAGAGIGEYLPLCHAYPWASTQSHYDPMNVWWVRPVNDPKWKTNIGPNVKNTLLLKYTTSDKTVRFYNNGQLFLELGPNSPNAPHYLKKWPDGDYGLPISPRIHIQDWDAGCGEILDIGVVRIKTSCPYHYAGYAVCTGHFNSFYIPSDGQWNYPQDDLSLQSMHNFTYWHGVNGLWVNRFTNNLYTGFVPPITTNNQQTFVPGFAKDSETKTFKSGITTGQTLPVHVPPNTKLKEYAFQGTQRAGTLTAKFVNNVNQQLTTPVYPSVVLGSFKYNGDISPSNIIRAEVTINYNGSSVQTGLPYNYSTEWTQQQWENMHDVVPDTPSMFVGFEAYFEDLPQQTVTIDAAPSEIPTSTYTITGTCQDNATLSITSDQPQGIIGSITYNRTVTPNTWSCEISNLSIGANTITVIAYDEGI